MLHLLIRIRCANDTKGVHHHQTPGRTTSNDDDKNKKNTNKRKPSSSSHPWIHPLIGRRTVDQSSRWHDDDDDFLCSAEKRVDLEHS